jgi:Protein of unknown function (DUF3567)
MSVDFHTDRPRQDCAALKSGSDGADPQGNDGFQSGVETARIGPICLSWLSFKDPEYPYMHMLYNSDNFAVVQIDLTPELVSGVSEDQTLTRGGYEIVDKFARKELFIEGALAEQFKVGVDALIESSPSVEEFDAYLEQFSGLALQPVVMH